MSYVINPFTGQFDRVNPEQDSVKRVVDTYTANENISALNLVRVSGGGVIKAFNNGIYEDSKVLGLALTAALSGAQVDVLIFGTLDDAFFGSMSINETMYLNSSSILSQVVPLTGYLVRCGKYLGNNIVLIQIEEPVLL